VYVPTHVLLRRWSAPAHEVHYNRP
jgi:hypothetical protein